MHGQQYGNYSGLDAVEHSAFFSLSLVSEHFKCVRRWAYATGEGIQGICFFFLLTCTSHVVSMSILSLSFFMSNRFMLFHNLVKQVFLIWYVFWAIKFLAVRFFIYFGNGEENMNQLKEQRVTADTFEVFVGFSIQSFQFNTILVS